MRVTEATTQYSSPISNCNASSAICASSDETNVTYTNTGFGQLPVRCNSNIQIKTRGQPTLIKILLITALILSLTGLLYLLIYVTITYTHY